MNVNGPGLAERAGLERNVTPVSLRASERTVTSDTADLPMTDVGILLPKNAAQLALAGYCVRPGNR
jgi:hypothetical protein